MKPALNMDMFNWEVFLRSISPLSEDVVELIVENQIENGQDEDEDEDCYELFQQKRSPVEIVKSTFSGEVWYPKDLEIDSFVLDILISTLLTFIDEVNEDLELESIGTEVPSFFSEMVSGWEDVKVNPDSLGGLSFHSRSKCKYDYIRETRWLGWRPFRYPGWKETIPLDRNPSKLMEHYYIPNYSFHTPDEVQKLYEEAEEYADEVSAWPNAEYVEMFNESYLDGLEVAARNKMGLFCWLND
ncbi:MAG: hypothetical protein KDA65_06545 [Planctomycetaceae bacterium]|nr:hypothetical protein [Planctomycetaceae bacterium]